MVGETFGHYEILEPLGAGGMGEVYRARDTSLDRDVAIKVLHEKLATDATLLARFDREARLLASINHPNIATIHGLDEVHGTPYLVLELVEGESLAEQLARGPLAVDEALETTRQVAAALEAAHEKEIIHRDLKPANVMVTPKREVKVLDFGVAKAVGLAGAFTPPGESSTAGNHLTASGALVGTVAYMSPEQIRGKPLDKRSDIWSFGCVLYEVLTGRKAFDRETIGDTLSAILDCDPRWDDLPGATPTVVRALLSRILRKDPERRLRDIGDARLEIEEALRSHGILASSGTQPTVQPSIAVLPFVNMSADPENEYFSDGLAEELIDALTKLEGLNVVSRTSAFRFRGRGLDIREIGRDLNVGAVLEGSVRKAEDRLRITAQLVNVADGYHLWSERYDRALEDVFAIQEEIARTIVDKLQVRLVGREAGPLVEPNTENLEAYNKAASSGTKGPMRISSKPRRASKRQSVWIPNML